MFSYCFKTTGTFFKSMGWVLQSGGGGGAFLFSLCFKTPRMFFEKTLGVGGGGGTSISCFISVLGPQERLLNKLNGMGTPMPHPPWGGGVRGGGTPNFSILCFLCVLGLFFENKYFKNIGWGGICKTI